MTDEMTVGRHLHHPVTVGTRHAVDAVRSERSSRLRRETGTTLVITTAEEVIHGTDTGNAAVDEGVYSLEGSTQCVRFVSFCLIL
jgi:hypothetical protein